MMKIRGMLSAVTLIALALGLVAWTQKPERKAGDLVDGRVLLPTEQLAGGAGTRFTVIGRPVDLVTSADTTVYLKTADAVWKLENGKPTRSAPLAGASLHGLAITPDGTKLLATDAGNGLHIYTTNGMKEEQVIRLPSAAIGGSSYPCGLGVTPDGKSAWVCLSRSNLIVMVDLTTGKIIHQIPVEPAPYDVALLGDHAVVTCWGRTPTPHSNSALSSGTSVSIDDRGISSGGSLCFVDLKSKVVKKLSVPRQPSEILVVNPQLAYVPCAADDQLLALNPSTQLVLKTIPIRMRDTERGGVAPNALCISPDKSRLYLACGGINAIAVIDLVGARERITGFIPTDWYPIAVTATQNSLLVANAKGLGSRSGQGNKRGVYDFLGTINSIPLFDLHLAQLTSKATSNARTQDSLANPPTFNRSETKVVPMAVGQKSPIKHVFYILKENRTYDQVFGDLAQGNSDPSLVMYGRKITPNHHALAEEFVLLDNYYCNGVLSADGHAWAMEGNATSYFERSFGGWTRSYPFGDDPLSVSGTGFLWNNVLSHGKSFRNYGEFDYSTPTPGDLSFSKIYRAFTEGKPFKFKPNIGVASLRPFSNPSSPGWNMNIPDVVRAEAFIKDFTARTEAGSVPDLSIIYLPQDHTSGLATGMPKPESHVADNDLALGRVVEAISHSKVWGSSAIFVNEDDAQDGVDHVDGHRSLCLVVSPFARRGAVISEFYNQTSALRTMEAILGIPPMNRMDATANLMDACFQASADLRPYVAKPNQVRLDAQNMAPKALLSSKRKWARLSNQMDFRCPDSAGDDDLNQVLWAAARPGQKYPMRPKGRFLDGR